MSTHGKEPGILKLTLSLAALTAAAGVILGFVATQTMPLADANDKRMQEEARKEVLPDADRFEAMAGHPEWMEGRDKTGKSVGYVIQAVGKGYGGEIKMALGVDNQFKVVAYKITQQNETPGLGDGALKPKFRDQFKGKSLEQLEVVKRPDPQKIQAITGATITSRGVTKIIAEAVQTLQNALKGKAGEAKPGTDKPDLTIRKIIPPTPANPTIRYQD